MKIRFFISLYSITLSLFSCSEAVNIDAVKKERVLDSAAILDSMNITEVQCDSELMLHDPLLNSLNEKLITADLTNMYWACTCPNWCYWEHRNDVVPAIDSFCVYLEPAAKQLELNPHFFNGRVSFTGRFYKKKSLPPGQYYMEEPNIPEWYVFRYYSYKINMPYTLWGPEEYNTDSTLQLVLTKWH